ncbi:MAG: polysaccharide deacetylase family protein, partial [Lactococcus sp.]
MGQGSRSRQSRSKKHKKSTFVFSIVTIGLVLIGVGVGAKLYHDKQVEEAKVAAYQKEKDTALKAQALAYESPTTVNIDSTLKLADHLNSEDKAQITEKIKTLKKYVDNMTQAKAALAAYKKSTTDADYKLANEKIKALTSSYEKNEKTTLTTQLATSKNEIDKAKAAAAAAAEKAKYANKKLIALSFDDGPGPITTPKLLKILAENDVKATFFALGAQAQAYPDIIKSEAANGNEVASHTWDHKNLVTLTAAQQKEEILSAHDYINSLTGQNTNFFRPPYGSYNQTTLAQTNLAAVDWSIDTNDWKYVNNTPIVVQNAVNSAHDGAIILMHDIHSWSVDAVPQIIQQLKAKGYTFVT